MLERQRNSSNPHCKSVAPTFGVNPWRTRDENTSAAAHWLVCKDARLSGVCRKSGFGKKIRK